MKRNLLLIVCFIVSSTLFSLQVDIAELKKVKGNIEFVNYTGKHTYIETIFDIRSIGVKLAKGVTVNNEAFHYFMKYSIIHAIGDNSSDKLSADIFSIDAESQIDHIRNINAIISSYLSAKYGYSQKDANTLATFVTYYNAVYRGDIKYFESLYYPIVIKNITAENAGISTKYYEWPGKSKIIIPLTKDAAKGNISSLNTSELTTKQVIDKIKENPDMGLKDRNNIVTLKEKEIEKAKQDLEKKTKDIEKQKEQIKQDQTKIDEQKKQIDTKKQDLTTKEQTLQNDKEKAVTEEQKKQIDQKQKELDVQKEQIKKDEETVAKKQEDLTKKTEEVKKQDTVVEQKKEDVAKKQDEVQQEKTAIKNDEIKTNIENNPDKAKEELKKKEEELIKKEETLNTTKNSDQKILASSFYYLKIKDYMEGGHYNNELFMIDLNTKKIAFKSDLTNICGNRYEVTNEGIIVISYKDSHSMAHNLTLLDKDTLKVKITGNEDIFWRSFIEMKDGFIYAVIKVTDTEFYLGKFDLNLKLTGKSSEKISSDTFITFYENNIFINSIDKDVLVLKKDDLSLTEKITP